VKNPGVVNLNLLLLSLPSESISHVQCLRFNPGDHPSIAGSQLSSDDPSLTMALYLAMRLKETSLASKAFCAATGNPDPFPHSSREALIEALCIDYQFFGLASGKKHTEQLVKSFETRAIKQSKAVGERNK
jgi:hypothetical protein